MTISMIAWCRKHSPILCQSSYLHGLELHCGPSVYNISAPLLVKSFPILRSSSDQAVREYYCENGKTKDSLRNEDAKALRVYRTRSRSLSCSVFTFEEAQRACKPNKDSKVSYCSLLDLC